VITFPRRPYAELYLGGEFRNVATDIRQGTPITINQGRKDEGSKSSPAKCSFTLDDGPEHGDGDYNPNNAMGQWYGKLARNTPVRVGLERGEDLFTRANGAGWGVGPLGTWSNATADNSIVGNRGRHSINGTATYRYNNILPADLRMKNVDLRVDVAMNINTVHGQPVEPAGLMARGLSGTQYYAARVSIAPSTNLVNVSVHMHNDQLSSAVNTVPGLVFSGQTLRIRFQADDNTFRVKVWSATAAEPLNWHIEYSHGDTWGAGWIGIRSGVAGGNINVKPITFDYSNLQVRIPRFAGEVSKMVPLSEKDHSNQRTTVEANGIMRRLGQGKRVLDTAFQRYLTGPTPFTTYAYWAMDGDQDSNAPGAAIVGGGNPAEFSRGATGAVKWGEDAKRLSVDQAVRLTQGGTVAVTTNPLLYGTSWSVTWTHQLPTDSKAAAYIFLSDGAFFMITLDVGGRVIVDYYPAGGGPTALYNLVPTTYVGDDNQWNNMGFSVNNTGAVTDFLLSFEGTEGTTYAVGIGLAVIGKPVKVAFTAFDTSSSYSVMVGQVALYPGTLFTGAPVLISLVQTALNGYRGEAAGTRFARLLTEEGVPYALVGYPTITQVMGSQSRRTLLELIEECVACDLALLYEPRGSTGLAMRSNRSMVAKAPVLTLDYSAGHVSDPFRPTDDDQGVVNDVTAKRPLGGEIRAVQTTGPMNVNDPGTDDNAIGVYDTTVTINSKADGDLIDVAGWRKHVGTTEDSRFPTLTVNLAAPDIIADGLTQDVLDVGMGDGIDVTNLQAARIYDAVRLKVQGYTEIIDTAFRHTITFNTTPASPYDGATLDSAAFRLASDTTILNAQFVAGTDNTMSVVTTGGTRWITNAEEPGAFPMNIRVSGSVLQVNSITGTGTGAVIVQTFAVTVAPVNGVTKTIPVGTPVNIDRPIYLVP
jgi:hypothetical protein